jgi:RimJ/RimL family protein N-acetyltransferase/Fe-S-cluster containining protein
MMEANPAWIGWLGWYAIELGANDHELGPGIDASPDEALSRPQTLVGSVGFKGPPDKEGAVEMGYSVLPVHQGRGLATEMSAALVGWAAEQGAHIVQAQAKPANPASIRVLEKLGFQEIGIGDQPGTLLFAREAGPCVVHPTPAPLATDGDLAGSPDGWTQLDTMHREVDEGAQGWNHIETLHREVDEGTRSLEAIHRDRLRCRPGCCFCCVDEITVFEIEAERIQRHHPELLATGEPHPVGGCAFLDDDGACRIYEHRPYVCRTQGLPLRWEDETPAGEPAELRDICPLNESGPAVAELPAQECWEIGPFEERLAALQAARDGGRLARVRLRDLFAQRAPLPGPTPDPAPP